jgi:hypothetical protein
VGFISKVEYDTGELYPVSGNDSPTLPATKVFPKPAVDSRCRGTPSADGKFPAQGIGTDNAFPSAKARVDFPEPARPVSQMVTGTWPKNSIRSRDGSRLAWCVMLSGFSGISY